MMFCPRLFRVVTYRTFSDSFNKVSLTLYSSITGIAYRPMVITDEPQVRSLLYNDFFTKSKLGSLLKVKVPDECKSIVDRMFPASISDGFSVVGEDIPSKSLVGLSIGRIFDLRQNTMLSESLGDLASENEKIMVDYMENYVKALYTGSAEGWFRRHKVERFVKINKGTVRRDLGGKSIIKGIVLEMARISHDKNVHCLVSEAAHPIPQRVLEVMGFEVLSRLPMSGYMYNGQRIFKDSGDEHLLFAKVFSKDELNNW